MEESDSEKTIVIKPSIVSMLVDALSFFLFLASYSMFIFSILIIIFINLREFFLNWAIMGLVAGYILRKISQSMTNAFGMAKISFSNNEIVINKTFGKQIQIEAKDILHLEVYKAPFWGKIFRIPFVKIMTNDAIFDIKTIRFSKPKFVGEYIKEHYYKENIYIKNYYYKKSLRSILENILSTFQGKVGIVIILIYFIIALLGALSYIIDPPHPAKSKTFIFFNPEYLIVFTDKYGSHDTLEPPNSTFWFGTDVSGRDIFSRMIFGTTFTVVIALVAAVMVIFFIIIFGITTAIYGGWWDDFITRISDVLLTFPQVVWIILISVISTPLRTDIPGGFYIAVYMGMSLVSWPQGARLIRAEVLEAMNAEYVQAVKIAGASRLWIIRKHVVPKIIPTVMLLFFYQLTDIIIGISLLGYLGFGSESTLVWGSDLSKAFQAESLRNEWWTIIFPTMFIFFIVLGLTLFSDALRDSHASQFKGGLKTTLHSSLGGSL